MTTFDEIVIVQAGSRQARIQLLAGDLTAIPEAHAVDILVCSAFPNDYTPLPGSLFYAFGQRGFSIQELAQHKMTDLRETLSCWLSHPLSPEDQGRFHFKQLLCLEPTSLSKNPVEIVGNIFRCLNNFAFDDDHNSIAMPIVASGRQQVPVAQMLPMLLEQALFWLRQGLPLECIKIVLHTDNHLELATSIFNEHKARIEAAAALATTFATSEMPLPAPPPETRMKMGPEAPSIPIPPPIADSFDVFISYAHKQQEPVHHFVKELQRRSPHLNIFYDRENIQGGQWLRLISDAIAKSKKVVVFLSPDYSKSPVCWDEFQCAKVIEYNKGERLIQTIYVLNDAHLPPIMAINSYIDCRETDLEKLMAACTEVLEC